MKTKESVIYISLSLFALVSCWYFNFQHIQMGGSVVSFIEDGFKSPASSSISIDLCFLFLSLSFWMYFEGERLQIKKWWIYPIIGLLMGISFSFPLFLIHRMSAFEKLSQNNL